MDYLYDFIFKPGIQKDGTSFQGTFCTDARWIRWQRGKPRTIGGMIALNKQIIAETHFVNIYLLLQNQGSIFFILGFQNANHIGLTLYKINNKFKIQGEPSPLLLTTDFSPANIAWQFATIINDVLDSTGNKTQNTITQVLCLASNNNQNINNESESFLFVINNNFAETTRILSTVTKTGVDGGLLYESPYLFLYGSRGTVKYSDATDKFNEKKFTSITISDDKVIYGAAVRGGILTLIFWTMNSVVRVTNVASATGTPEFRVTPISKSTSILSSRCVVEFGGIYYWIGTNDFFVYNGLVESLPNTLNFNYFFDNLDIQQRQLVFGVAVPKFKEIWWYYPIKGKIGNSRVLIYNIELKTWYITEKIYRNAGMTLHSTGITYTLGQQFEEPDPVQSFLWAHEQDSIQRNYDGTGLVIRTFLDTPWFGDATFSPDKQFSIKTIDRWTFIKRFEPDIVFKNKKNDTLALVIYTKNYAQDEEKLINNYTIYPNTGKIDLLIQARNIRITFVSNNFFELGNCKMLLGTGDVQ